MIHLNRRDIIRYLITVVIGMLFGKALTMFTQNDDSLVLGFKILGIVLIFLVVLVIIYMIFVGRRYRK